MGTHNFRGNCNRIALMLNGFTSSKYHLFNSNKDSTIHWNLSEYLIIIDR